MRRQVLWASLAMALVVNFSFCTTVRGQQMTTGTDQKSDALKAAEEAQALAEAKKAESEAELAIAQNAKKLKALSFPTSESAGVEGKTTVGEGAGYLAEILVYQSLREASENLVKANKALYSNRVVITDDFEIGKQFHLWNVINTRIEFFNTQLDGWMEEFPVDEDGVLILESAESGFALALSAIPNVLGSIDDIAKFFKTNTEIINRKVSIPHTAVSAAVAQSLLRHDAEVVYGGVAGGKLKENIEHYDVQ